MILEGVRPADVAKHRPWIAVARPIHDAGEIRASLGRRRYKTSTEAVRPEDRGIEPGRECVPLDSVRYDLRHEAERNRYGVRYGFCIAFFGDG